MATSGYKVLFFTSFLAILWCCFSVQESADWTIDMKSTPSSSSRYFILHDWQNTYSQDTQTPLPAAKVSNIMLKTMGILREGASWPGVVMSNLFNRPLATALFIVDGIAPESSPGELSSSSFEVDQTGLTGCACGDSSVMFRGDHVAQHLSDLFDQNSQTNSISANIMVAERASANGAHTSKEQFDSVVEDIQKGHVTLAEYGLQEATTKLELSNEVDAQFIAELVLIKETVEQLRELTSYVQDASPDVFVFTISSLESMEKRYGKGSDKMVFASKLVKQVIQESTKTLVELYDGRILVQALVLEWNHPEMDKSSPELASAYTLLQPYLAQEGRDGFMDSLPHVGLKEEYLKDSFLCSDLRGKLKGTSYYVHCPQASPPPHLDSQPKSRVLREAKNDERYRRQAEEDSDEPMLQEPIMKTNVTSIADSRSNLFSGIFLIFLFVTVSLGLTVLAVSWALWNMDPGRDSVIYRQVADPTVQMK